MIQNAILYVLRKKKRTLSPEHLKKMQDARKKK